MLGTGFFDYFQWIDAATPTAINTMPDVRAPLSDVWYTIDGRRVANGQLKIDNGQLPRGVYIHNGKKVVIK